MRSLPLLVLLVACAPPEEAPDETPAPRPVGGKADDGSSWVVSQIESWNARLAESDREAKYAKLAEDAPTFFRGTNHLFWSDFYRSGLLGWYGGTADTRTFILGDLHLDNLGSQRDAAGRVVYAMNDYDESVIADYQLDLWRMGVALTLMAREQGFSPEDADAAVDALAGAYLDGLAAWSVSSGENDVVFTKESTRGDLAAFLGDVEEKKSRKKLLDKWSTVEGTKRKLTTGTDKLAEVPADDAAGLLAALGSKLEAKGVGKRLGAGTGSLGVLRYYVLIEGESEGPDDDVILDVKEQPGPTAYAFFGRRERRAYDRRFADHAERAVQATRAMAVAEDPCLDSLTWNGVAFTVRELDPWGGELDTDDVEGREELVDLAAQWGQIIAAHHARGDRDYREDWVEVDIEREIARAIDGDAEGFRRLVRDVAVEYADQVEADHAEFEAWLERRD